VSNPHLAAPPVTVGPPVAEARRVALVVHGRDQDPAYMVEHLVGPLDLLDVAFVLPAADGGTWYPGRFNEPRAANEPRLGQALEALEAAIAGVPPERLVLAGFSQGGCLVADLVARRPRPYAGAAVLTGALIGDSVPEPLDGLPIFMETSRHDGWVSLDHVEATARAFEAAGARVELRVDDDREHRIRSGAVAAVRALLA
jgi:phospholipase/carboxylesterase